MNGQPFIRRFRSGDQVAAKRLILQGMAEHFGFIDPTLNSDLNDIAAHYPVENSAFLVAELHGQLVGTAALVTVSAESGQIVRVAVAPECRRKGVAASMLRELLQLARCRNLRRVLVETNHDWVAAIELYKSLGFREFNRDSESVYLELVQ